MVKIKAELNWWQKRPVMLVEGMVGLLLAYIVVSRALDTGSWWQYLGTLLLLVLSIRLIVRGLKNKK